MTKTRSSRSIYLRRDERWKECDSEYEMGYLCGETDNADGWDAMTDEEHQNLWGINSDYAEGYRDAYHDAAKRTKTQRETER